MRERALTVYGEEIRAHRVSDRGALLPPEHGGAYDNNYGPISLSFLARAHIVSGEDVFAEDGEALARYIDARLTNGGFDNGGPRYSEQHSAFESVLGLRYFGARIGSDIGRYRGDSRWARHAVKPDGESTATSRGCWSGRSRTAHPGTAPRRRSRPAINSAPVPCRWPSTAR